MQPFNQSVCGNDQRASLIDGHISLYTDNNRTITFIHYSVQTKGKNIQLSLSMNKKNTVNPFSHNDVF